LFVNEHNERQASDDVFQIDEGFLEGDLQKFLPAILDMAWAYNFQDISYTLNRACNKLFMDAGANSRFKRMERADAIKMLGEEFLMEAKNMEHHSEKAEDLMVRLQVAFHVSHMKVSCMFHVKQGLELPVGLLVKSVECWLHHLTLSPRQYWPLPSDTRHENRQPTMFH
jgi:hypothetical protein